MPLLLLQLLQLPQLPQLKKLLFKSEVMKKMNSREFLLSDLQLLVPQSVKLFGISQLKPESHMLRFTPQKLQRDISNINQSYGEKKIELQDMLRSPPRTQVLLQAKLLTQNYQRPLELVKSLSQKRRKLNQLVWISFQIPRDQNHNLLLLSHNSKIFKERRIFLTRILMRKFGDSSMLTRTPFHGNIEEFLSHIQQTDG
jgi:hypothetical protein